MSSKTADEVLPAFVQIAPSIWEHIPPAITQIPSSDRKAPPLILMCTWTAAQNRHIVRYTSIYHTLFPSSCILLVTTTAKDPCFRSSQQKQQRLTPAINCIKSSDKILMHIFSEGGSNKACELAEGYYKSIKKRLPVSAICLDSTPGRPRFFRLCDALNKSLPPTVVPRYISLLLSSAVIGTIWLIHLAFSGFQQNVITKTRQRILEPTLFNPAVPRCYLYS